MKKNTLFLALGGFVTLCLLIWGICKLTTPKIAYVDNVRLFADFKGKKDLEARLKKNESTYKLELDSLQMRFYSLNEQFKSNQANHVLQDSLWQIKRLLDEKSAYYKQSFADEVQQYDAQVWKQINQYMKDYGAQNSYDYILGNTETGSLMYTKSKNDITNEVLQFINKKYDGH